MSNDSSYPVYVDEGYTSLDENGTLNCSLCLNELCLSEDDYSLYKSWVSVDTYEMVLISINIIVFLTGIIGNSLVGKRAFVVLLRGKESWY